MPLRAVAEVTPRPLSTGVAARAALVLPPDIGERASGGLIVLAAHVEVAAGPALAAMLAAQPDTRVGYAVGPVDRQLGSTTIDAAGGVINPDGAQVAERRSQLMVPLVVLETAAAAGAVWAQCPAVPGALVAAEILWPGGAPATVEPCRLVLTVA